MKPANQLKSVIKQGCFKLGLKTGTTSGKASFNASVKPKFILAFNANIFFNLPYLSVLLVLLNNMLI
ncbi:hypothetical protein GCM10023339_76140 [Alloalcanivorax gelatiniphagus]